MNWSCCGKPVVHGDIVHDENTCLRVQLDKANLQIDEAKALLKRFLDAGPEEEYQVILCKLSGDVEAFLSDKQEKRNDDHSEVRGSSGSGPVPLVICVKCGLVQR